MAAQQCGASDAARRVRSTLLAGAACVTGLLAAGEALAQNVAVGEVIVTARKRQESILNVPVVEHALSQQQLERTQTNNLQDIAKLVPGLTMGETSVSTGAQVSLRGVGTSSLALGVEQSVALNIDGMQLTQGIAYRSAMFDTGQVEVLKGPQSLFYGKSSPGGVISIRTADPTDRVEVIARAGYEFVAREKRGELIVSGPVSDTLKLRLAGMYDDHGGYFKNPAVAIPGTGARDPSHSRMFDGWDYVLRGTALWNPTSSFDARLKVNYSRQRTYNSGSLQFTSCPDGVGALAGFPPFISPNEDCKLNRTQRQVDYDPAAFPPIEFGGVPQMRLEQKLYTLELNYRPTSGITLSSATGLYDVRDAVLYNTYQTSASAPLFSFAQHTRRRDFTQEFRVNSDFTSPLNFTAGGFYQDGLFWNRTDVIGNSALGLFGVYLQNGYHDVHIQTYSLFGQARWDVTSQLEIAAGARWASEKRTDKPMDMLTGRLVPVPLAVPRIKSDNVSPELTVTYRLKDTLTVFGSLKKGYKSGSFNMAVPALPGEDNAFEDEKVEGGEIGFKSRLLDRRLAFDMAAYHYKYTGLQVGATEAPAPGELPVERTVNAGSSKVYGVEFNAVYRPEVEGLVLNLAVNWNHGRYTDLRTVPCSAGQTIAEGCNQVLNPNTGLFIAQDLSGLPLARSPDWQVNFGFDYSMPVGDGMELVLSNANQYVSKYPANLSRRKDNWQDAYFKADLSLALHGPNDRWEIALIGKNVTDKLTAGNCTISNFQGEIFGTIEGGTARGPAGVGEVGCFTDRGREVWVRFTFRPTN